MQILFGQYDGGALLTQAVNQRADFLHHDRGETFARLVQASMASASGALRHRVRVCSLITALSTPPAPGAARLGADLIAGRVPDLDPATVAALSPERFA